MDDTSELHNPLTGEHLTFLTSAPDDAQSGLEVRVRLDPGGRVPRHFHLRQDERIELLSGSLMVTIGGSQQRGFERVTPSPCHGVSSIL